MRRLPRVLLLFCVAFYLFVGLVVSVLSQGYGGAGWRYFAETGHNIRGEFLTFFDRYGGVATFGLPRTEEYDDGGLKIQYFQRARMELHPNNPLPYRVQLSLLGDLLGYRASPIPASAIPAMNHPQRRYYPQTGHTLSYAFLQYYDSHGGLDVFGYPITELLMERGTVVQYFQRGKMEWHAENPIAYQITLGNLGDEFISRTNVPGSRLAPVQPDSEPPAEQVTPFFVPTALPTLPGTEYGQPAPTAVATPTPPPLVLSFEVSASVKYPITGQGGLQTVYVRVVDDRGQGVGGAVVEVLAHFRNGSQSYPAGQTDASGYATVSFNIGYPSPGYNVMVEVRATLGGRTEIAHTSFIPWW